MDTSQILEERGKTHGEFTCNAMMSQTLKETIRRESPPGVVLSDTQAEALDMICHKIARIICGNPDFKDHWDDIAGYATLVANELEV